MADVNKVDDLKLIRKRYGEKMMHLCRTLFPTILETEGLLFSILEKEFAYSKLLVEDIIKYSLQSNFRSYIYSFIEEEIDEKVETKKTPKELMSDAGYILYECKSESDIQSFKKYYKKGEELCTFNGGRLDSCYVFFAVKKDVDKIKRNILKPERQDDYGISVISIQFSRGKNNVLSIKNRYNHTVTNPDATFSNNLENIISGLTYSMEQEYGLNIEQDKKDFNFSDYNYIKANDGKYYKYNYEINNIYYCPDNIIIDNFEVKRYEKEKYIITDYFMLDLVNKKIDLYDSSIKDSFLDELTNIDKIEITKQNDGKIIKIIYDKDKEALLKLDKFNRIIGYKNDNLKELKNNFLQRNKYMQVVSVSNVETIGDQVFTCNKEMRQLNLPKVTSIGNYFFRDNERMVQIYLPNVKIVGDDFLFKNNIIEEISLPNVEVIGNSFFAGNDSLKSVNISNVESIGYNFLLGNDCLEELSIPKVKNIGEDFLCFNKKLKKIDLSDNVIVKEGFLDSNMKLLKLKILLILKSKIKSKIISSNSSKGRGR